MFFNDFVARALGQAAQQLMRAGGICPDLGLADCFMFYEVKPSKLTRDGTSIAVRLRLAVEPDSDSTTTRPRLQLDSPSSFLSLTATSSCCRRIEPSSAPLTRG